MGFVQILGTKQYTTTSSGITTTAGHTAGNPILVIFYQTGVKSFTVADSASNTYARIAGTSTGPVQAFVTAGNNALASGQTITPSWSLSDNVLVIAFEITGYPATIQANPGSQTGSGTTTTGSITPSVSTSLLISALGCAAALIDGLTYTEDGAWTEIGGVSGMQHTTASLNLHLSCRESTNKTAKSHAVGLAPSESWNDLLFELGAPDPTARQRTVVGVGQ